MVATSHSSDVDLVYLDLCAALEDLNAARPSPRQVRRTLSRYVEISQRLTATMRRDFSSKQGKKWQASRFTAWTEKTELLKYLRNQDQHADQIFITVHFRDYYAVPDDIAIAGIPGRRFVIDGIWHMTDQTLDRPPEGLEVSFSDPGLPPLAGERLLPVRTENWYEFYPRNNEQRRRFENAQATDVHAYASDTFAVLSAYYEHYKQAVDA